MGREKGIPCNRDEDWQARESLMSLEAYAKARPEFRTKAVAH